jgi:hypothetical protein
MQQQSILKSQRGERAQKHVKTEEDLVAEEQNTTLVLAFWFQ